MVELSLLKALSTRDAYFNYIKLLNPKTLATESLQILNAYRDYFSSRSVDEVDFNDFKSYFFIERNPNLDEKSIDKYNLVIDKLIQTEVTDNVKHLLNAFKQQEFYNKLHDDLDQN